MLEANQLAGLESRIYSRTGIGASTSTWSSTVGGLKNLKISHQKAKVNGVGVNRHVVRIDIDVPDVNGVDHQCAAYVVIQTGENVNTGSNASLLMATLDSFKDLSTILVGPASAPDETGFYEVAAGRV